MDYGTGLGHYVGLTEAEQKLAEALWARYKRDAEEVLEAVARLFEIKVADLVGPVRRAILVDARSVCALILRSRGLTLSEIGHLLHRDHSSIHALCQRIEGNRELKALADGLAS